MVLPLFALGLLTAGTGIAKGLYDETQEQKRKKQMLDALYGPSVEVTDSILNPQVGPPTAQTSAYMQLARARAKDDPFGAVEWAQGMVPQQKDDKFMDVGGRLVRIPAGGGKPSVEIDAANNPKSELGAAEKLVKELNDLEAASKVYGPETDTGKAIRKRIEELSVKPQPDTRETYGQGYRPRIDGAGAEMVPGGSAAVARANDISNPVNSARSKYIEANTTLRGMADLAKDESGASDIGLVYSFFQAADPGSRVTENEFDAVGNKFGLSNYVVSLMKQAAGGKGFLTPEVRAQLVRAAGRQVNQRGKSLVGLHKDAEKAMSSLGVDVSTFLPWSPKDIEVDAADAETDISALRKKYGLE